MHEEHGHEGGGDGLEGGVGGDDGGVDVAVAPVLLFTASTEVP